MKYLCLSTFILVILLSGCKKGKEDPFFSFRSRENRLCGKWRVKEFEKTYYDGNDPYQWQATTYKLKANQVSVTSNGVEIEKYAHIEDWIINEDGTYEINYLIQNVPTVETGNWSWNPKDKNKDFKNKECVYLTTRKYNYNNGEEFEEYTGFSNTPDKIIVLEKLSNKKIKYNIEYETYIKNSGYWMVKGFVIMERQD